MEKTVLQMSISLTSNYQPQGKDADCGYSPPEQSSSGTVPGDGGHSGTCGKSRSALSASLQKQNQTS